MTRVVSHRYGIAVLMSLVLVPGIGCGPSTNAGLDARLAQQDELLTKQQDQMRQMSGTIEQLHAENQQAQARLQESANRQAVVSVQQPQLRVEPRIAYMPTPAKKEADLLIKSVSVYPLKANGSPWDASGSADLKVRVTGASGGSFTTRTHKGTTYASYNVKATRVAEGDEIIVEVLDDDVLADDTIGTYTKQITADTIRTGTVNWSFGQVSSLVLEFQP